MQSRRPWPIVVLLLALVASGVSTAQAPRPADPTAEQPARPRRPAGPPRDRLAPRGTSRISGRVTDASGLPLRRAQVTISAPDVRVRRMVLTDMAGRYSVGDLPAGRYTVTAEKPGYVMLAHGQRRPGGPGRVLQLADGEHLRNVDIALPRGGVIAGRVVDELGEPVADVRVTAERYVSMPGGRRLMPVGRGGSTDDLGQYRLWGLPPGEYYVRARIGGRFELADGDLEDLGPQAGFAPVYYPGSASLAEAQRVRVEAGQETGGIDFVLLPIPVVRVAGRVVDSAGRPVSEGFVLLLPRMSDGRSVMEPGPGSALRDGGTFAVNNVVPGDYTLMVRAGRPDRRRREGAPEVPEAALVRLTVGPGGATDLVIATSPGARISGRVVFDGQSARPSDLQVAATPAGPGGLGGNSTTPGADGTFTLTNLYGAVYVRLLGRPTPWTVKAVELDGEDVTDLPLDTSKGDITGLRVVLTDRPAGVSGIVRDASGAVASEYLVVVFADDPVRWEHGVYSVFTAGPDQQGQFTLAGLRPGTYRAVALAGVDLADARNPELLERLRPIAEAFQLREGQTVALALTLRAVS
jgi:protocatechuate 3,4-dioxygenase beta subunit